MSQDGQEMTVKVGKNSDMGKEEQGRETQKTQGEPRQNSCSAHKAIKAENQIQHTEQRASRGEGVCVGFLIERALRG